MLHLIGDFTRRATGQYEFNIANQRTDARAQLMGVYHANEVTSLTLPLGGYAEQIVILREEDASQLHGAAEQLLVGARVSAVLLGRHTRNPRRLRPAVIAAGTCTSM